MTADPKDSLSIPEWMTQHIIDFIESNNIESLVIIALVIIAGIYGVIVFSKKMLGYQLSKEELTSKQLSNIKALHDAQDAHDERAERSNCNLSTLFDALEDDSGSEILNELRETTILFYTQKYLPSLNKYLDTYEIYHKRRKRRRFVKKVLRKEMDIAVEFRNTVNCEPLLEIIGRVALPLDRSSFDRVWQFWQKSLTLFSLNLRKELREKQKEWPESESTC